MDAKDYLFIGLGVALAVYGTTLLRGGFALPTPLESLVGFVTAFFDTLGIGSFATTAPADKVGEIGPGELIPGPPNGRPPPSAVPQRVLSHRDAPVRCG